MDDFFENQSEWNVILGKLAEQLFHNYFNDANSSAFSFEYSKYVNQFKEDASLSVAEHLNVLKIQTVSAYKGAFTREMEGRLIKESLYFQKKFDEAYNFLCHSVKQEFVSQMEHFQNTINSSFREQLAVLKSQTEEKIEKVIHTEKMHLERKNSEYLQCAQKNLDLEKRELDRVFSERLLIARQDLERDFRENRELEKSKLEQSHKLSIEKYKAALALKHEEELEKYHGELKAQLSSEVNTWLTHQVEQLKLESNANFTNAVACEQNEYVVMLESKKQSLIGQLDQIGRTIKLQTKTKKAKEQVVLMEQQAAQMLRDLASAVHQIRLQSNIHIDTLRSDFR